MRLIRHTVVVLCALAVLLVVLLLLDWLLVPGIWYVKLAIDPVDNAVVLDACREMVSRRMVYAMEGQPPGVEHLGDRILLKPRSGPSAPPLPRAVAALRPRLIVLYPEYAVIRLHVPHRRIAIIGFSPDGQEFGTEKIIDGLWFWDGTDTTGKLREKENRGGANK